MLIEITVAYPRAVVQNMGGAVTSRLGSALRAPRVPQFSLRFAGDQQMDWTGTLFAKIPGELLSSIDQSCGMYY